MKKIFAVVLFIFCGILCRADEYDAIQLELRDLKAKYNSIKSGFRIDFSSPNPFYCPKDVAEKQKSLLMQRIESCEKRKTDLENALCKVKLIQIDLREPKQIWWSIGDEAPDLYLKFNGKRIGDIYYDAKSFKWEKWQLEAISFSIKDPCEIEVWDKDFEFDDFIFKIHLDGRNNSPLTGNSQGFSYTVEWERQ